MKTETELDAIDRRQSAAFASIFAGSPFSNETEFCSGPRQASQPVTAA